MYFLRQLRSFNLPQDLLITFYSSIIDSVLDRNRLQRKIRTVERIFGATCPPSRICTGSWPRDEQVTSPWTPHTLNTNCLNSAPQFGLQSAVCQDHAPQTVSYSRLCHSNEFLPGTERQENSLALTLKLICIFAHLSIISTV